MADRVAIAAALLLGTSACGDAGRSTQVAICDIATNPAAFDKRWIRTRVFYHSGGHGSYFSAGRACDFALQAGEADARASEALSNAVDDAGRRNARSCDAMIPEILVTGRVSLQRCKLGDGRCVSLQVTRVDELRLVSALERDVPGWQLLLPENPAAAPRPIGLPGKETASCRPY